MVRISVLYPNEPGKRPRSNSSASTRSPDPPAGGAMAGSSRPRSLLASPRSRPLRNVPQVPHVLPDQRIAILDFDAIRSSAQPGERVRVATLRLGSSRLYWARALQRRTLRFASEGYPLHRSEEIHPAFSTREWLLGPCQTCWYRPRLNQPTTSTPYLSRVSRERRSRSSINGTTKSTEVGATRCANSPGARFSWALSLVEFSPSPISTLDSRPAGASA